MDGPSPAPHGALRLGEIFGALNAVAWIAISLARIVELRETGKLVQWWRYAYLALWIVFLLFFVGQGYRTFRAWQRARDKSEQDSTRI